MKKLKKIRAHYLHYLKQNPRAYRFLRESCNFLGISKEDFKRS